MEGANKYSIEAHLKNQLVTDIYQNRFIPIYTEDDEARLFLETLFEYYSSKFKGFALIDKRFHFVKANLSSEALRSIFSDDKILKSTMGSICILDGDQEQNKKLSNHIIVLPGKCSPEDLLFSYADKLLEENSEFWTDSYIISLGYSTVYYLTNIKSKIDKCKSDIDEKKSMNITTNGMRREGNKKIFKDFQPFFTLLIKYWIHDLENSVKINDFYKDLNILFKKVAEINNINSSEWNI